MSEPSSGNITSALEAKEVALALDRQKQEPRPKRGPQPKYVGQKCRISGCKREAKVKEMCQVHYVRSLGISKVPMGAPIRQGKTGSNNPKWKGGIIGDGHGRVLVYSPNHPFPNYCGTHVYRYRLVMEDQLGRYLRPEEIVHHKNGIMDDDRKENLEVMTQSNHCKTHHFGGDHGQKRTHI